MRFAVSSRPCPASSHQKAGHDRGVAAKRAQTGVKRINKLDVWFAAMLLAPRLRIHLNRARIETAPGSAHALNIPGLQSPDISFWTIWDDETLLGFGALKRLSADHGEVKSMHTA
jgi:hypothetical protein